MNNPPEPKRPMRVPERIEGPPYYDTVQGVIDSNRWHPLRRARILAERSSATRAKEDDMSDELTVDEARVRLERDRREGTVCPCCDQTVKEYRRQINNNMARTLIEMWRKGGDYYAVHTPSLPGDTHEASQLAWWGLIEESSSRREDGGRAGWWIVTERGRRFLSGTLRVPKYVFIYNGKVVGKDKTRRVSIQDALGTPFDFNELMSG